ncbi:hypothetical protein L208DRAFT_1295370, partial [Tricholoma matsutake]
KKHSSSGSRLKPRPPKEYDRKDDPRLFHQFVKETMDYLEDGQVACKCQI